MKLFTILSLFLVPLTALASAIPAAGMAIIPRNASTSLGRTHKGQKGQCTFKAVVWHSIVLCNGPKGPNTGKCAYINFAFQDIIRDEDGAEMHANNYPTLDNRFGTNPDEWITIHPDDYSDWWTLEIKIKDWTGDAEHANPRMEYKYGDCSWDESASAGWSTPYCNAKALCSHGEWTAKDATGWTKGAHDRHHTMDCWFPC